MIFRQLTHDDLGCASYLIGDEDAGVAAVVDPKLDIDEYLRLARYLGVRIEHILETHNHADHVSGHGRLVAATGATIHIHRDAEPDYDHEPFDDGWELELGSLTVRALHTPGHRPEHTAFALVDTARSDEPWAVLTGDTLFVGDIARPDLAVDKEEGARGIFHSLNDKLMCAARHGRGLAGAPRRVAVRRARHGPQGLLDDRLRAGQPGRCCRSPTRTSSSRRPPRRSARSRRTSRTSSRSTAARWSRRASRRTRSARARSSRRSDDGALVVDVRTELQFDEAHIPGAVSITARRAGFGSKLAWLAKPEQPIVLVGRDDDDAIEAAQLAGAVGLRNIAGYLAGGMTSWREDKLDVDRVERMTVPELHDRWERDGDGLQVLDVREQSEWDDGYIPGSVHEPYHDIHGIPDGIDPAKPVAVICGSGQRSAVAASLLQRFGAEQVIHVVEGGVPLWKREGWPTEQPEKA